MLDRQRTDGSYYQLTFGMPIHEQVTSHCRKHSSDVSSVLVGKQPPCRPCSGNERALFLSLADAVYLDA